MSLNFVSTSVLSSTDGVSHNTETQLQPTSSASLTTHRKPLFEQLRENAEKDQEKYDEVTKAMRGTTTLDEDDVAFIQGMEDSKAERKFKVKQKEEEEIQMFRAARLEKTMIQSELVLIDDDDSNSNSNSANVKLNVNAESSVADRLDHHEVKQNSDTTATASSLIGIQPKIIRKRRRRAPTSEDKRTGAGVGAGVGAGIATKKVKESSEEKNETTNVNNNHEQVSKSIKGNAEITKSTEQEISGLGGLLAYGSDSDSD